MLEGAMPEREIEPRRRSRTELTASVVIAYVTSRFVATSELAALIASVDTALRKAGASTRAPDPPVAPKPAAPKPAVPVRVSIQANHLLCLECGRSLRSMKRHLQASHGLTPDEYRDKWGLASDYPMIPEEYSQVRSDLAKKSGLGKRAR
jgi:predicted transcriptional regulator